jgi:predicted dehydrogenase
VLEDKSVDAVSIATPNHWHALMTIWACQAGKDVYVEKPMSHNIHEGRIAVETARKYKRIVQHGTQSRSDMKWAKVAAAIASGKLGKLLISRALCYKSGAGETTRGNIGFRPHKQPPKELDFNLWLGPAREQPYHENIVHYRWHNFWDFGNGDLGNQGVHQMDIARWGIPGATLPKSIYTFGGRLGFFDQGDAASTQMAIMDFGGTKLIFETRGLPSEQYRGVGVGNIFHLEAGDILDGKFYPKGSKEAAPLPEVEARLGPGAERWSNFILAVRSRNRAELNADVLEGHYSAALCHLCNMSIRLGSKVPFRPQDTSFGGDADAIDVLERTEQYLAKNGVDVEKSGFVLGRKLVVDAKTETIVGDAQANQLLTRDYRKGFAVPEKA